MKIQITNYTFNKSTKQITFTDYSSGGISLASILLITDVAANQIVYNFADPSLGGTVSGNVLTTTFDTSALSNSDSLLIYYDDPLYNSQGKITDTAITSDANGTATGFLRGLVKMVSNVWDSVNSVFKIAEQYISLAEDNIAGVLKIEKRYSYSTLVTLGTNGVVSSSAGFVDHVNISCLGDQTGKMTINLRDSGTAGAGTIVDTKYIDMAVCQNLEFNVNALFFSGISFDFSFTGSPPTGKIQTYRR